MMRKNNDLVRIAISFLPGLFFVLAIWSVKLYEWFYECRLYDYGLFPRTFSGLRGIITMPFLHGDFEHLISNSIPLLVLVTGLVYFYRRLALKVGVWIWLLSGFWLWLGGRPSFHVGASAIIYGLTVFLFFSGVFRKDRRLMALSLLVVFLYGGLIWGILPIVEENSWEGHLFGSCAGLLMAVIYRGQGPQRPAYSWEIDNDAEVEDGPDAYWKSDEGMQSGAQP